MKLGQDSWASDAARKRKVDELCGKDRICWRAMKLGQDRWTNPAASKG